MNTRKTGLFVITMAIFSLFRLHADWGSFNIDYGAGGIPVPVQNKNIVMEKADIKITAKEFAPDFYYECGFTFKNITSSVQTVTMGFPIQYTVVADPRTPNEALVTSFIQDFSVKVNNTSQPCTVYTRAKSGIQYDELYTFSATFQPNEEKSIFNVYRYTTDEKPGVVDDRNPSTYVNALERPKNIVHYIIKTGGLWAAPIGELSISITFENMPYEMLAFKELETSGFVQRPMDGQNPNRVVLYFDKKGYLPAKDISIQYFSKSISAALRAYTRSKNFARLEELLDYSYLFDVRYGGAIWGDTWRNSRFEIYDTIDYETERYADFQLANAIMYSNTEKAVRYYILAFRRAKDNSDGIVDPDILLLQPLGYWQQEGANDAPAYFIAYNLACSYSLMNNVPLAAKWLRIAVRLNPELIKSYARGDRDLENVRGNDALFKEILGSEPASPVISNPAMNTIVAEYDRLRSALRFDASAVTRNKIEFRYVPANVIACAVVIYYEAKTDGTIRVEFIRNGMHSMTSIGMGIVNAPAGRGLIVVPISPRTSYDDFPVAGSETYFIARLVTPAETAEAHYSFPAGM